MKNRPDQTRPENPGRRKFMRAATGVGMAAGIGPWLASCGLSADPDPDAPARESRNHYFDLSNADHSHDFFLVVGGVHHPIVKATDEHRNAARVVNPNLQRVPDHKISHVAQGVSLPADRIQMVFVKSVAPGQGGGPKTWTMHHMFFHIPSTVSATVAQARTISCAKTNAPGHPFAVNTCVGPALPKAAPRQISAAATSYCSDPSNQDYKSYFDQALALVCHHPEICTMDAATLAYIQQQIVCMDASIVDLAESIYDQGPASTASGGWATLVPYLDPDTKQPKMGSDGNPLYYTQYSDETKKYLGAAIAAVLPKIKDDPVLGANITQAKTTDTNADLKGKLWVTRDGSPARSNAPSTAPRLYATASTTDTVTWTQRDVSSQPGFTVENVVANGRKVTFTIRNWYVRHLGLYIRYLNAVGDPIALQMLPDSTQAQFSSGVFEGAVYDGYLGIINPELVILGVPVHQSSQTFTIEVPDQAASFRILCGGIGSGSQDYPATLLVGQVMTAVFEFTIPGIFLASTAYGGYQLFQQGVLDDYDLLKTCATTFVSLIQNSVTAGVSHDNSAFLNVIFPVARLLIKSVARLNALMEESIAEGEAIAAAEDAIPFGIGLILQAVQALGLAAQLAETSAEVANSPWTYDVEVNATHDLTVTIRHDPRDVAGFPATATHYEVVAVCDYGSPTTSGPIAMPSTTRTDPFVYTFRGLPDGGQVTVTVCFYSQNGWLAGVGTVGPVNATQSALDIVIEERLVPLVASTRYSHKQKIVRDAAGNHVWQATSIPPARNSQSSTCDAIAGQICSLVGITLSENFGAIGYAWQSYSESVSQIGSSTGAKGQLFQFANISFTQNPQAGYVRPNLGARTPFRLAYVRDSATSRCYYVDSSGNGNIVRQIRMTGVDTPPTIDLPGSNKAVARLNFPSDALVIDATGALISINASQSKMEVVTPLDQPVADSQARMAQSLSGIGTREGLMAAPVCIAATTRGLLILEAGNNRIQSFDTGANPAKLFQNKTSAILPLRAQSTAVTYLDLAVEAVGYIYVLYRTADNRYFLDIYDPDGNFVCSTEGLNAGKFTLDLFRNVFTLNYEVITPATQVTEPSISQWIPSTP